MKKNERVERRFYVLTLRKQESCDEAEERVYLVALRK